MRITLKVPKNSFGRGFVYRDHLKTALANVSDGPNRNEKADLDRIGKDKSRLLL